MFLLPYFEQCLNYGQMSLHSFAVKCFLARWIEKASLEFHHHKLIYTIKNDRIRKSGMDRIFPLDE
jgi:hypothetical protein